MEADEKILKPEESIKIIEKMIQSTKRNLHDSSFYFLLWGWVVLIGSVGQIILKQFTTIEKTYLVWLIIFPGMITSIIYGIRHGKKTKVSTHLDSLNFMIWIAFIVSYTIVLVFMKQFNYNVVPIIFLLAGNATFLTGIVIKFKALVYGGIVFWLGTICQFLISTNYVEFVSPVIIIFGYLIPGYLLKLQNKKNA